VAHPELKRVSSPDEACRSTLDASERRTAPVGAVADASRRRRSARRRTRARRRSNQGPTKAAKWPDRGRATRHALPASVSRASASSGSQIGSVESSSEAASAWACQSHARSILPRPPSKASSSGMGAASAGARPTSTGSQRRAKIQCSNRRTLERSRRLLVLSHTRTHASGEDGALQLLLSHNLRHPSAEQEVAGHQQRQREFWADVKLRSGRVWAAPRLVL